MGLKIFELSCKDLIVYPQLKLQILIIELMCGELKTLLWLFSVWKRNELALSKGINQQKFRPLDLLNMFTLLKADAYARGLDSLLNVEILGDFNKAKKFR